MRRAVILGIDGLSPELVKLWLDDLPNLKKMQSKIEKDEERKAWDNTPTSFELETWLNK